MARRALFVLGTLPGLCLSGYASGGSGDLARSAQAELVSVESTLPTLETVAAKAAPARPTPEQRLANGELLLRSKDYERALDVLSRVIEEHPGTFVYPDALWLRAETYYATKEYLSARHDLDQIVSNAQNPRFARYVGRALGRLVDLGYRLAQPRSVFVDLDAKLSSLSADTVDAGVTYARGKVAYKLGETARAQEAFQSVRNATDYAHQARYFLGLIAMKQARAAQPALDPSKKNEASADYKRAIEAFRQVTELSPDTADRKHVIDLAWMAIGRLFYEMEQYQQAAEAYLKLDRDSQEFDTMLYELAWVYVRLGDAQRAERALEVLSVADPNSAQVGDGTLLRADILLRAGAFNKALKLYEGVLAQYSPMLDKVDRFMHAARNDRGVYFEKLSQRQLDALDQNDELPKLALTWAREVEDGPLAFALLDDIHKCRTMLRKTRELADRLSAMVDAPSRVRAFPDLQAAEEAALALINRVSRARLALAKGMDDEEPSSLGGEMGEARARRRKLMGMMENLPIQPPDFAAREQAGSSQWNKASQEITKRQIEVDHLLAVVAGLRRMLKEEKQHGVERDPKWKQHYTSVLDAEEKTLIKTREELQSLRRAVEVGRSFVGLGDAVYQSEAAGRLDFRTALEREVELAIRGDAGTSAANYARSIQPMLRQARETEDKLQAIFNRLEDQVSRRVGDLRGKIDTERANLSRYASMLETYDGEARQLVGHVAERNFQIVKERLRNIVLRGDVGITEQAWEVREEEAARVRSLLVERSRQERLLDDELREVRDDTLDPATKPQPK